MADDKLTDSKDPPVSSNDSDELTERPTQKTDDVEESASLSGSDSRTEDELEPFAEFSQDKNNFEEEDLDDIFGSPEKKSEETESLAGDEKRLGDELQVQEEDNVEVNDSEETGQGEKEIELDVDLGTEEASSDPGGVESDDAPLFEPEEDEQSVDDDLNIDEIFNDDQSTKPDQKEGPDTDDALFVPDDEYENDAAPPSSLEESSDTTVFKETDSESAPLLTDLDDDITEKGLDSESELLAEAAFSDDTTDTAEKKDLSDSLSDVMGEDKIGIDADNDALWEDDDESDDISLFEDVLLQEEIAAEQEKSREEESKESSGSPGSSGGFHKENEDMEPAASDTKEEDSVSEQEEEDEEETSSPGWVPWVVSASAFTLSAAACVVFWMLAAPFLGDNPPPAPTTHLKADSPATASSVNGKKTASVSSETREDFSNPETDDTPIKRKVDILSMDLTPFLIPAQKEGELVFLKLKVELIVTDHKTLAELRKRKAWVRDAIYMELKGIEIKPGMKGDILMRYRRPVLERLNRELAPVQVQDLRLMGVMLK